AVDTAAGRLLRDAEIKLTLAKSKPYGLWLKENSVPFHHRGPEEIPAPPGELDILGLTQRQTAFGISSEEVEMVIEPMARDAAEAVGSMGDDTPLAVLSLKPRLLPTYFKQLFAQVTNPPIDPIREKLVMSLYTLLGWRRNLLSERPEHCRQVMLDSPILLDAELEDIRSIGGDFRCAQVDCTWPAAEGASGLEKALSRIRREAEAAADDGFPILILSDRAVNHERAPVPMLLAMGAVHHHLRRVGKRMKLSVICETGEARDVHQTACLIGYGASCVNPYLAFETLRESLEKGKLEGPLGMILHSYRKALENGLLKIMSKMGISVVSSYRGAQIFEALGLSDRVIEECFAGTPSQIGGIGYEHIAEETLTRHQLGFGGAPVEAGKLEDAGYYRFRRGGELHAVTPPVIQSFHTFVGIKGADKAGRAEDYRKYVEAVQANRPHSLRNLLEMVPLASGPVPIEEVEPVEDI
ncbi:MAG: hypothetical protein N2322_06375, partial [Terrimicrobiaceae bacterium]|nr:hypothetical protein [Terrimicrobiaceae bacterium]